MKKFQDALQRTQIQKLSEMFLTGLDSGNPNITDVSFDEYLRFNFDHAEIEGKIKNVSADLSEKQVMEIASICQQTKEKGEIIYYQMGILSGARIIYELLLKGGV